MIATRPRLLAAGAAAALFAAVAASAGLDWPRTTPRAAVTTSAPEPGTAPPVDPEAVVASVERRPRPVPGTDGTLESLDDRYRATFDERGFALTPTEGEEAFAVSLRTLGRTGAALTAMPGRWRAEPEAARRVVAPGVTERVRVREGEIEWDLVLDRRPAGTGDLRVDAALTGPEHPGRRHGDRWRFTLPGGDGVRLGEVVVVDATGAELHRALPEVGGGHVRLVVPGRVLDGAVYPLVVDPTVSPERPLSPPSLASSPAVATDGTEHLVVWQTGQGAIEGAVVDPSESGPLVEGVLVASGGPPGTSPAVAFDGTNYLVVWRVNQSSGDDIVGVRVSPAGVRLDGTPIAISGAAAEGADPAVAFDGTNYLVVWEDLRTGTFDVLGTRVSPAGSVVGTSNFVVGGGTGGQTNPDVSFDGVNHLVVWADTRAGGSDILGTRVTPAGSVLDAAGIAISSATGNQVDPAIAFGGEHHLVVWEDLRAGNPDVFGARVRPSGTNLNTAGIAISQAAAGQSDPDVVFDGPDHLVVWEDARAGSGDVVGTRVSASGTVRSANGVTIASAPGTQGDPAVAFASDDFDGPDNLVVWRDTRSGGNQVFGTAVDLAGAVADPVGLALSASPEGSEAGPAVAFDGTNSLVVWEDNRFSATQGTDIVGARVTPEGSVLDPAGLPIARVPGSQFAPDVAYNGSEYLVVFQDHSSPGIDVVGTRVTPSGAVLQAAGIGIAQSPDVAEMHPAVASDGANHLVVWSQLAPGGGVADVFGTRVSGGGLVLDPGGFPVSDEPGHQREPDVTSDGTSRLVVWEDSRAQATTGTDVFAARVNGAGAVLDPNGIAVSQAGGDQARPAVASGGGNHLVVWDDLRSGPEDPDVFAARVSTAGVVRDPAGIPVSQVPAGSANPAVAFNGTFLVAWIDNRNDRFGDVLANRVSGSGQVLDGSGFVVTAVPGRAEVGAGASRGAQGTWQLPYSTADLSSNTGTEPSFNEIRSLTVSHRTVAPK